VLDASAHLRHWRMHMERAVATSNVASMFKKITAYTKKIHHVKYGADEKNPRPRYIEWLLD